MTPHVVIKTRALFYFILFDDSNLHYTHAHTVWGGQRGFEPLPNGGEFSLAPLGQMPSGPKTRALVVYDSGDHFVVY